MLLKKGAMVGPYISFMATLGWMVKYFIIGLSSIWVMIMALFVITKHL
jgi:hypothetical protein